MTKRRLGRQGQTLLIVIFAMSLGLLVMVNTASRVVASVARTAQTNNYQKAVAVAEGGAEIYLAKPFTDLATLAGPGLGSCPTSQLDTIDDVPATFPASCIEKMNGSAGESRAFIGVEKYPVGTESLFLKSKPGETIHINLQSFPSGADMLRVCWKGLGIKNYSLSYYFLYKGSIGNYEVEKQLHSCDPDDPASPIGPYPYCVLPGSGDLDTTNIVQVPYSGAGYWCYYINLPSDPITLRIFTFPDGADYMITALRSSDGSDQALAIQGYRIVSIGEVLGGGGDSLESRKATRKKVTVEKTFPYPVGPWWDFAVTSVEGSVKTTP